MTARRPTVKALQAQIRQMVKFARMPVVGIPREEVERVQRQVRFVSRVQYGRDYVPVKGEIGRDQRARYRVWSRHGD